MTKKSSQKRLVFCVSLLSFVVLFTGYFLLGRESRRKMVAHLQDKPYTLSPGVQRYIQDLNEATNTNSKFVDTSIAEVLSSKLRVLCLVLTTDDMLDTKGKVVKYTWAKHCNKFFFMLKTNVHSPDIINSPYEETRKSLVHKVKYSLQYVYENHINDFDWIIKADHDTFVIVENLRYLLSHYSSNQPGYLGFHFNKFVDNGYMSGGAGYVISNSGLRHLVENGFDRKACPIVPSEHDPENSEDIEIGRCLNVSGVPVLSSLDSTNKETFHPYPLEQYLTGSLPSYLYDWANNLPQTGTGCCSQFAISFHYMTPESMLLVHHLLYMTSVYGHNTLAGGNTINKSFKAEKVEKIEKVEKDHKSRQQPRWKQT